MPENEVNKEEELTTTRQMSEPVCGRESKRKGGNERVKQQETDGDTEI